MLLLLQYITFVSDSDCNLLIQLKILQNIAFQNFNVQAGMDGTGVPTDMLTLNSTVKILYRNPATFFGVHVTSKPLEFHYYDLKLASGYVSLLYFNSNTILLDVTI